MESDSPLTLSEINLLLQARFLVEIILHPLSCLAVIFNWQSFYNTRMPERLMYLTSGGWVDLPTQAAVGIKRCFESRSLATRVEIQGNPFTVNLLGMVLVDADGHMSSIAWTDGNGKPFFPKKVFCGGVQGIFNRIVASSPTLYIPKPSFDSMEDLERLEEANPRYKEVRETFLKGMRKKDKRAKVTAVYACKHSSTFGASWLKAYERLAEITIETQEMQNTRYGWYGSSPKRLEEIITKGFGLEDAMHGAFGCGIYFAPEDYPSLSASFLKPDIEGEYHMMLCKITLGNAETVQQGSNQYGPSEEHYANGTNDTSNPKCYIIWSKNMSTHILPQYVVSFRVSERLQRYWRRLQLLRASYFPLLDRSIPLRPADRASVPRPSWSLQRYNRNKNGFL